MRSKKIEEGRRDLGDKNARKTKIREDKTRNVGSRE